MGIKLWEELAAQGMIIGMDAAEVLAKKIDALNAANIDLAERVLYAERERDELNGRLAAALHSVDSLVEQSHRITAELARKDAALEHIASATMSMFLNKDHMLTNMIATAQKALS